MTTNQEIIHAYRNLYRAALRAVHYSSPARHVIRARLRRGFRECPRSDFEPGRIENTLTFLEGAQATAGLEHRLLRSLCLTWYWEMECWSRRYAKVAAKDMQDLTLRARSFDGFYHHLRMLNETMGMCIR